MFEFIAYYYVAFQLINNITWYYFQSKLAKKDEMGFCCLWGFRRRRRECLTGSLSTRDMGPLDFFQGSELLVTGERVFNLILHIPSSPSSSFFFLVI